MSYNTIITLVSYKFLLNLLYILSNSVKYMRILYYHSLFLQFR